MFKQKIIKYLFLRWIILGEFTKCTLIFLQTKNYVCFEMQFILNIFRIPDIVLYLSTMVSMNSCHYILFLFLSGMERMPSYCLFYFHINVSLVFREILCFTHFQIVTLQDSSKCIKSLHSGQSIKMYNIYLNSLTLYLLVNYITVLIFSFFLLFHNQRWWYKILNFSTIF